VPIEAVLRASDTHVHPEILRRFRLLMATEEDVTALSLCV
jgi:hypothetical protein